jgi:hypothetical protein
MQRYLLADMNGEILGDFDEIDAARDYAKAYVGENAWQGERTIEDDGEGIVELWENGDDSQDILIFDAIRIPDSPSG